MTARPVPPDDRVSRRRYERAKHAQAEAERLLERLSRDLWQANEALKQQAADLEEAVALRTEELTRAKREAEAANAAKSAFLAMISHELRTPMNAVLGMAAGLEESGLPPAQYEMARVILSSGRALLDILNDLLDLSKIEAGKMEVEARAFAPADICDALRPLYADLARGKGLGFALKVMPEAADKVVPEAAGKGVPEAAGRVVSDPTRLRQVIGNLLSNAIKFTDQGHVHATVTLSGTRLEVVVEDTGPGVPEAARATLFQAFQQADASITRKFGGTGLGLAISRQICRMLGGDLVYEPVSEAGGARFRGHITVEVSRTADARVGRRATLDVAAILSARRWRVLAADDSATNQKVLGLVLRPYGLDLTCVDNGALAVERHCSAPFDLVLMDVNMPVMDGLEAAALIRTFEEAYAHPRVPIIALTANAMTHQVADYMRRGIDAHVAKPLRREALSMEMARLLLPRVPEDVPEDMPEDTPEDTPNNTRQDTPQPGPEDAP